MKLLRTKHKGTIITIHIGETLSIVKVNKSWTKTVPTKKLKQLVVEIFNVLDAKEMINE